jgi:hypothetical protein
MRRGEQGGREEWGRAINLRLVEPVLRRDRRLGLRYVLQAQQPARRRLDE